MAQRHASRRFRRFCHFNLSTVCTHSLHQFAGILRALCVSCAEVCSLSVLLLPSMSNNYALSVRYKIILASGHYYVQINGWCSLQSRAPQIGPQSLNRRYASFLLFCLKCSEAFASGQLKILPVSIAAPSVYIQGAITKCSEAFASGQVICAPVVFYQGSVPNIGLVHAGITCGLLVLLIFGLMFNRLHHILFRSICAVENTPTSRAIGWALEQGSRRR